jgi:predicted nuclease of predicted toxin-antitoxin system
MRFLADVNFQNAIVTGLRSRDPSIDILLAQDVGLRLAEDVDLLAWAAQESRIVLTHDRNTMPHFAWQSVAAGQPMAGVIVVGDRMRPGAVISDLHVIATCSEQVYWSNRVEFLS